MASKEGVTEVDRVILAPTSREAKIIEAKWISNKADKSSKYIEQVLGKKYVAPSRYQLQHYLVLSGGWAGPLEVEAKKEGITLLSLDDLF